MFREYHRCLQVLIFILFVIASVRSFGNPVMTSVQEEPEATTSLPDWYVDMNNPLPLRIDSILSEGECYQGWQAEKGFVSHSMKHATYSALPEGSLAPWHEEGDDKCDVKIDPVVQNLIAKLFQYKGRNNISNQGIPGELFSFFQKRIEERFKKKMGDLFIVRSNLQAMVYPNAINSAIKRLLSGQRHAYESIVFYPSEAVKPFKLKTEYNGAWIFPYVGFSDRYYKYNNHFYTYAMDKCHIMDKVISLGYGFDDGMNRRIAHAVNVGQARGACLANGKNFLDISSSDRTGYLSRLPDCAVMDRAPMVAMFYMPQFNVVSVFVIDNAIALRAGCLDK